MHILSVTNTYDAELKSTLHCFNVERVRIMLQTKNLLSQSELYVILSLSCMFLRIRISNSFLYM